MILIKPMNLYIQAIQLSVILSSRWPWTAPLPPNVAPFTKIVAKKIVSVSTKIIFVIRKLITGGTSKLSSLYQTAHSRSELVATFLAVLELCKANRVEISGDSADTAEIKIIKRHNKR